MDLKQILKLLKAGHSVHPNSSCHKALKKVKGEAAKVVCGLLEEGQLIAPGSKSHEALKELVVEK